MDLVKSGIAINNHHDIVAKVTRSSIVNFDSRENLALITENLASLPTKDLLGYSLIMTSDCLNDNAIPNDLPIIHSVKGIEELNSGDIIALHSKRNYFRIIYRIKSYQNAIFATEACNSNCLMCSQPPKEVDPNQNVSEILKMIELIAESTESMGITGGEPCLLGDNLIKIIEECKNQHPNMSLHMLSNGRLFKNKSFARKYAAIHHPDIIVGIPLYSDIDSIHDYVVQAKGAFYETISGIHNLGKHNQKIEIRVVLHKQTYQRLPQLARFIYRNMSFVNHIALMGLEITGYVRKNFEDLWIDPFDYQSQLYDATEFLAKNGMKVSIYNHQLCVLDKRLWKFAKPSISDWKNDYMDECNKCDVKHICGGFFKWNPKIRSNHIKAIKFK